MTETTSRVLQLTLGSGVAAEVDVSLVSGEHDGGKGVLDYTPTRRNITDADRTRVRDWMKANPHAN